MVTAIQQTNSIKRMDRYRNILQNTGALARYNMRIVFGGKFIYFVGAALIFFLVLGTISAFEESYMSLRDVYGLLIFPTILLVFYPSAFGIQNDADQRTLEIIFGIPDYRYKVWLVRLLMVLVIVFIVLFLPEGILGYLRIGQTRGQDALSEESPALSLSGGSNDGHS